MHVFDVCHIHCFNCNCSEMRAFPCMQWFQSPCIESVFRILVLETRKRKFEKRKKIRFSVFSFSRFRNENSRKRIRNLVFSFFRFLFLNQIFTNSSKGEFGQNASMRLRLSVQKQKGRSNSAMDARRERTW